MKTIHKYWKISELIENTGKLDFPEFQREPTVWKLEKKQRLIDSILRDFDISSIYLYKKKNGGYDCIDGRQRINAIWSFLGINGADEEHNGFNLKIENEIYNDGGKFGSIDSLRYSTIDNHADQEIRKWAQRIRDYKLNIVEITDIENDEELNLLFLRLQIASVLNAGEKLHAMTGDMRDSIFLDVSKHAFFDKISVPARRFVKEQIAAQIVLNEFSKRDERTFHRSRYVDMQDFLKTYSKFKPEDKVTIRSIKERLDKTSKHFGDKLRYIHNRAIAVSVYLFVSHLIQQNKENEIDQFVQFFEMFLRTLKWQLPKGVQMHSTYHKLLEFQTNITQAAGEKSAIERRHDFLDKYFYYYKQNNAIDGDDKYIQDTDIQPETERRKVRL